MADELVRLGTFVGRAHVENVEKASDCFELGIGLFGLCGIWSGSIRILYVAALSLFKHALEDSFQGSLTDSLQGFGKDCCKASFNSLAQNPRK